MSRKFRYLGPFDEVTIDALGVNVTKGSTVEIEDPEVSAGLDGQTDSWEHIPDPDRSAAAKKAAAKRDNDSEKG